MVGFLGLALLLYPSPASNPAEVFRLARTSGFLGGAVVVREGRTIFTDVAGPSELSKTRPIPLCSVTKLMTAQVVLDLVRERKLKLTSSVRSVLADLPAFTEPIQIAHLLTHSSGLRNMDEAIPQGSAGFSPIYSETRAELRPLKARLAFLIGDKPAGPPGAAFSYNNLDFLLLQAIIEAVEKKDFGRVLKDRVLGPAGMRRTTLAPWGALPKGTLLSENRQGKRETRFNFGIYGGSGGVVSTLDDVGRWLSRSTAPAQMDAYLFASPRAFGFQGYGAYAYRMTLLGTEELIVERPGAIANYNWQILVLPERRLAVAAFSYREGAALGSAYEGKGLVIDLARAALAGSATKSNTPQ